MTALADLVARSLDAETQETFQSRIESQAAFLREAFASGTLENDEFAVGLEMEVYAVERDPDTLPRLQKLPAKLFEESEAVTKELGVHNAEVNTDPSVFDTEGLAEQAETIELQMGDAYHDAAENDAGLVLDAMWTVPPEEGSMAYLSETEDHDGLDVAANMRPAPRYVAIDKAMQEHAGGELPLSVPGADLTFPSILYESLATSIQPHLQIPSTEAFPDYYNAAIRTLGPLLALAANSPFLPGDLYGEPEDPEQVVEESHHELRIAVFEQSVNVTENPKVRVPRDIENTEDVIERILADDLVAPFLREWVTDEPESEYTDNYWEFEHKRGTYWRWLRCVIGGDPVGTGDERSVRIEYRPLPTQPTVADVVGLQALTAGLIHGLVVEDHPIADLAWEDARESFYEAACNGLDGELVWLTADGERTTDKDAIFGEVFDYAERGLQAQGIDAPSAAQYLDPIRDRWDAQATPSTWKKDQVREHLDDGATLEGAITEMQRTYIRLSRQTDSFSDWL